VSATEQQYYEFLARTDHPVFERDFSAVQTADSPLNSILNRVMARQLINLRADLDGVALNVFPQQADVDNIGKWEERYFGFTKPSKALGLRQSELLTRINRRIHMSVTDARTLCQSITGQTPIIIRSLFVGGWVLDESALDLDTLFPGTDAVSDPQTYIVIFADPVDSDLVTFLDNELTRIEKGGSRHFIVTPTPQWVLDESALDVDTVLG
jgi:hypothetical protein